MMRQIVLPSRLSVPQPKFVRRIAREWALTIIILGGQLGIYLNLLVANWDWNNKLMPFAALLLPNWRNLLQYRLPSMSKLMFGLTCFMGIMWLYILWHPLTAYSMRLFAFATFLLFCFASLTHNDFSLDGVIKKVWIVSVICAVIGFYIDQTGLLTIMVEGSDKSIALIAQRSKLVVGSGCCVGIAAALSYLTQSQKMRWLVVASICLEFIVIIFVGKRTPLIAASACLIVYMFEKRQVRGIKVMGKILVVSAITILAYCILDEYLQLSERFISLLEYTTTGMRDVIYGTTTSGNISARYRHRFMANGLNYIHDNFQWYNYFIGAGTNAARMTDTPLLQAIVDMGLIGLIGYAGFVVALPVINIISKARNNHGVMFASLLCMYNVVSCMSSGEPYGLPQWIPAIFLVYVLSLNKKQKASR